MRETSWAWSRWICAGAVLVCAALLGCGSGEGGGGTPAATPAAKPAPKPQVAASVDASAEAAQIYNTRCVTCHGATGAGDGPGSQNLSPSPRDFRDPAWQDEVSDEHIASILQYGGAAVGRSPTMPGNPDLSSKPEVVAALVVYVRGLGSE